MLIKTIALERDITQKKSKKAVNFLNYEREEFSIVQKYDFLSFNILILKLQCDVKR